MSKHFVLSIRESIFVAGAQMTVEISLHAKFLVTVAAFVFLLLQMHQLEMLSRVAFGLTDLLTVQTQPFVV